MNAVASRGLGPSKEFPARHWPGIAVVALLGFASGKALALDEDAATERGRPQLEVSASSLPRFDADGSTRASRIDMVLLPPQRSALGLSFGMSNPDGPALTALGPRTDGGPSLDLGLHWRHTLDSNYRVDVVAWRRLTPPDALTLVQTRQPSYGARVEMRLSPSARRGLVADRGFVGLQLESGARVSLRRTFAAPTIYYRNNF